MKEAPIEDWYLPYFEEDFHFLAFNEEWGFFRPEDYYRPPLAQRKRITMTPEEAHAWVDARWRARAISHYNRWMDNLRSQEGGDAAFSYEMARELEEEVRQRGLRFVHEVDGGYVLALL